jgi:hypothetical protein
MLRPISPPSASISRTTTPLAGPPIDGLHGMNASAGHAGSEAALATARMGQKTLLITINLDMVAFMPCNRAVAKAASEPA